MLAGRTPRRITRAFSSMTRSRIRVNLRHVPEDQRPPQETPDPDDDPTREWRAMFRAATKARPRGT